VQHESRALFEQVAHLLRQAAESLAARGEVERDRHAVVLRQEVTEFLAVLRREATALRFAVRSFTGGKARDEGMEGTSRRASMSSEIATPTTTATRWVSQLRGTLTG